MKSAKIERAIISVSDKSNLKLILPTLKKFNIEIISSGGSYKKIKSLNYNCIEVSNYTEFSEMLDGRIKTLHPKIHAGILNIRKNRKHKIDLAKKNIPNIDLVIVDLYSFEKKFNEKTKNYSNLLNYFIRFHIYPDTKIVKTMAGNSILISLPNREGWLLQSKTNDFKIEKNIFLGNKNKIINNETVFISGNISKEIISIKWEIERVS